MTIFDPTTGESNEKDQLLSLLMEWTTEPRLISAMVRRNRADFPGLAILAATVRATLDGSAEGGAQPMTERQLAASALAFLSDSETRNVLARYVAHAHADQVTGQPGESKYDAAKRDLYELRIHLQATHHLSPREIPQLFGGDPVEHARMMRMAEIQRALINPEAAWPRGEPKPAWVELYEREDYPMPDGAAALLRDMVPEAQEIAKRFPPMSLVRSVEGVDLVCPSPGLLAFVRGYGVEEGEVMVEVSAYLEPSAPKVNARPSLLELVACRGSVTREGVATLLQVDPAISS
jgi:hypothetical protein